MRETEELTEAAPTNGPLAPALTPVGDGGVGEPLRRLPIPLWVVGVVLLAVLCVTAFFAFQVTYAGRAYPGVTVLGTNVGALTLAQASDALRPRVRDLHDRTLVLRAADNEWRLTADELGMRLDADVLAAQALLYGRDAALPTRLTQQVRGALGGSVELPVALSYEETDLNRSLARMAAQVDRPAVDAVLSVDVATQKVRVSAAQVGRRVDRVPSAERIRAALPDEQTANVDLALVETQPRTTPAHLQDAADTASRMLAGPFVIRGLDRTWELSPTVIATSISVDQPPGQNASLLVDESPIRAVVRQAASELNQEVQDARLELKEDLSLELTPSRIGRSVDVDASVRDAWSALVAGQWKSDLVLHEVAPLTTDQMRLPARDTATQMVSAPFVLEFEARKWTLERQAIADLLVFNGGPGETMTVTLNQDALHAWLDGIAKEVRVEPQTARFQWEENKLTTIRESASGREMDLDAAMAQVQAKLATPERTLAMPIRVLEPSVTSSAASTLSVATLIESGQTSFAGAIPEKRHNIQLAAERLNGVIVPAGSVFSFNREVGPTTLEAGFQWGFGLESGEGGVKTIPSVAGGICQVATTLFQPVFWSGYQIEERHWHLYWIPAYVSRGAVGLDATVDAESNLDFQFLNNTPDPLLIQARTEGDELIFELYGTKPRWQVQVDGPTITNVVKPDETQLTQEDPTLPWGRTILVQTAREGFDSELVRTVTEAGSSRVLKLSSEYQPGRNITLVGTKDKPAGAPTVPPEPQPSPTPVEPGSEGQPPADPTAPAEQPTPDQTPADPNRPVASENPQEQPAEPAPAETPAAEAAPAETPPPTEPTE